MVDGRLEAVPAVVSTPKIETERSWYPRRLPEGEARRRTPGCIDDADTCRRCLARGALRWAKSEVAPDSGAKTGDAQNVLSMGFGGVGEKHLVQQASLIRTTVTFAVVSAVPDQ